MKKNKIFISLISSFLIVLFLSGCLSQTPDNKVNLELNIKNNQITNNGRVFYVVIRKDSAKDFTGATYETIYNNFLNTKDGENIFVAPSNLTITKDILIPKGQSVSVYFMFSTPGGKSWKYRITNIYQDESYTFDLGKNYIKTVNAS
ncbi:MAG: hypothetical protein GY756_00965 [bacterium]|nr:hypothetical protein [bacterium]